MRRYTDDGKHRVVAIECDVAGCTATLEPGPLVTISGWTQHSQVVVRQAADGSRPWRRLDETRFEVTVCPRHEQEGPAMIHKRVTAHRRSPFALTRSRDQPPCDSPWWRRS